MEGKYSFGDFNEFRTLASIQQQLTMPYIPEQKNRTLIEVVLSKLHHVGFTKSYWDEALLIANYIQNRLPTKALTNATPYELWHGCKSNLSYLKVFRCTTYVHRPKETIHKSKLEYKSIECWFLGYEDGTKRYHLQDKSTKCIIMFKDIIFQEEKLQSNQIKKIPNTNKDIDLNLQLQPNFF